MDKSQNRLTPPLSLFRFFFPNVNIKNSDSIFEINEGNDSLSKTLLTLIQNTKRLFNNDRRFNNVIELAEGITEYSDINSVLKEFSKVIDYLSKNYSRDELEEIFTIPSKIIESQEIAEKYKNQYGEIVNQCKNINNITEFKQSLQNIFDLLETMIKDSTVQKEELENFLLNIGIQISRIGEEVHNFAEEQSSEVKIHGNLNSRMHDAVNDISKNLLQADDLDVLKSTVKAQLDTLQSIVVEEKQVVKKHEISIKKNLNALTKKVDELKHEADVLREKIEIEKENALKDSLTGLFNREAYDKEVAKLIKDAEEDNSNLSLLIWDIDHFKKFNDTYGHIIGDKVLKAVTKKISGGHSYFLARYGGEEFVMLLPGMSRDETLQYAEELREKVSRITYLFKGKPLKVTISCGVSMMRQNDQARTLLERADKALYKAKMSGRNCVKMDSAD